MIAQGKSLNWRKMFISPVGMAIFAAVLCPLFLFLYGVREPAVYALFVVLGAIVGLQTQRRLKKNYGYLFENVEQNRLDKNKHFMSLLKASEVPNSKEEQEQFLSFLDTMQQAYDQAKSRLPQFLLAIVLMTTPAFATHNWWLLVIPGLMGGYTAYLFAQAGSRQAKLDALRSRIAAPIK